jgi:hypothetical protein
MTEYSTLKQLDEAAAEVVVPRPEPSVNGLPSRLAWVADDPARARAAWIAASTDKPSGDWRMDASLREECHLLKRVILRHAGLPELEQAALDTGPDGRRLWIDRVVVQP